MTLRTYLRERKGVRKGCANEYPYFLFSACNLPDKTESITGARKERCAPDPAAFPFILPCRYSSALLLPTFSCRLRSLVLCHSLSLLSVARLPPFVPVVVVVLSLLLPFTLSPLRRLFLAKDYGENTLARPAGLVACLVFDPVAADVEMATRTLKRGRTEKYRRQIGGTAVITAREIAATPSSATG